MSAKNFRKKPETACISKKYLLKYYTVTHYSLLPGLKSGARDQKEVSNHEQI